MIGAALLVGVIWIALSVAFVPLWAWFLRDRRAEERASEVRAERLAALARRRP